MDAKQDADADVSGLLQAWTSGDVEARDRLLTVVYEELRRRAAAHLRRERAGHTLQPTALVHEAYLRLVKQDRAGWQNRAQFFGVASQMMRRILVDRARARNMAKRSGRWARVTLDEDVAQSQARDGRCAGPRSGAERTRDVRCPEKPGRRAALFWWLVARRNRPRVWPLRRHGGAGMAGSPRVALCSPEPTAWQILGSTEPCRVA